MKYDANVLCNVVMFFIALSMFLVPELWSKIGICP